ncbi:phospholipid/cholesterol/gamma-HCH transport system substrate-binding protein [Crossiella equi]|uniref:Phospholipid/cholesterol/gamma-HCH transport system substrate-binding protein n=1 Tax=Crossiella equi TaxID=130796 RepID=A0ABS5AMJ3_9PSEU|nr:MCE family protein [Crossiella equi]MBP2477793.1 phospholipid/cholesterol/gamma-HCH transport system substrate-binding protein [Crossiella equi]
MRKALALVLVAACASGCGVGGFDGLYNLPLPGGADLGDRPYRVTAQFRDVLDLVPQAAVKVNDVAVGKVERIELAEDGRVVDVTVAVNGEVKLPNTALARLRQSSLLGEKYVELARPPEGGADTGRLGDGAVIPVARTNRNPEVEEVFGALSLLLNGGGVQQLREISRELAAAFGGKETQIKSLLSTMDKFVGQLDANKDSITKALDGLNKLNGVLAGRTGQIDKALTELEPGLRSFSEQREMMTAMLDQLHRMGKVAAETVKASKDDLVADLKALQPVLDRLAEAGQNLPQSLELLFTYPFPDAALNAIKGDYLNTYLTLHVKGAGPEKPPPPAAGKGKPVLPLPPVDGVPALGTGGR